MADEHTSHLRPAALRVVETLTRAGFIAYWAGGCVRDMLLGRDAKDIDIATSALPDQVIALFARTRELGKSFGVVQVLQADIPFEVATFRRDAAYEDGRHPTAVHFSGPEEDAHRRDFTINGLFYDPIAERVVDFVDGRRDIEARVLRAIGRPEERFAEDYLRMLRAVRFSAVLEFPIEEETAQAIHRLAPRIAGVSAERIQQELTRMLVEAPKAGHGLVLLRKLGLLEVILPEVARMAGQAQPPQFHPEGDVFTHTALMLDAMENPTPALAYAVLLHDVGKPPTAQTVTQPDGSERIRFDGHDAAGVEIADRILRRLRLPNADIEAVTHCVGHHMRFMHVREMRRAKLRAMVGAPTFPLELELHRLDCAASHGDFSNYEFLLQFVEELKNEPVLPKPWINGLDIMTLGVPEGPQVGVWHRKAYEAQLEGRFADRDQLLDWLRTALPEIHGKP